LRGYNNKHPKTWDEQLVYIQHSYNIAIHSSTIKSHFEICFGYLPHSPFDTGYGKHKDEAIIQGDEYKASAFMENIRQTH
jgi:hypothetical protein